LALLLAIVVWETGTLLVSASRTPFWYDELLTLHISSLRPFSLVWRALSAGADGMTPGYYALLRVASRLPADPHIALRVPSILGYILTLLAVYMFVADRLAAAGGLAAVLLTAMSPLRLYGIEARSYALLVGLLALSALMWQQIGRKRFRTPLFGLLLTLAVASTIWQ
jgi:hypothetical protein